MKKINKIIHVVNSISSKAGGPSKSVIGLAEATANFHDAIVTLISQRSGSDLSAIPENPKANYVVPFVESGILRSLGFPILNYIRKEKLGLSGAIVHIHGIWSPSMHWASRYARLKNLPCVIQPHGMLESWALSHHKYRKNIAMAFYQRRDLELGQLILATAESEYEAVRSFGLKNPVAVIPNGINLPEDMKIFEIKSDEKITVRKFLFLSRIHVIKGVINLLYAWKRANIQGWILEIAGPDDGGHLTEVIAKINELNLTGSVKYIGELSGQHKENAYLSADVFVLPTYSENFGNVVAEALSYSVPVITTKGAPWSDLNIFNCGWWIDIGVDPLVEALQKAAALSDEQRHEMGVKGRIYVQRYNWQDIAGQMMQTYQWILGHGSKPDCVRLD